MTIQSLGVGSGLALDDLVQQLLEAESKPKTERLDKQEEDVEAKISGLAKIQSKMSEFKDLVDDLRTDADINGREPTITNPNEEVEVITAEAGTSALRGSYQIAVSQLASGSRVVTEDGLYTSSDDSVLSGGTADMTFSVPDGSTFTVNVTAGMTLSQLREAINNDENNFGVSANIIDTGTAAGPKLVFSSTVTGTGNDLVISNDSGNAELDGLTTTGGTNNIPAANITSASNARATIDGITVESETNKFENTISFVSFTAEEVSPKDADGEFITSRLKIGYDREGLKEKVDAFIEGYNTLLKEIKTLTEYGESDLEEDGALAGDSLMRGIQTSMASIVSGNVSSSALGSLYQLGIEFNEDGELEIGTRNYGLGSGEDRYDDAVDDNFDEIAKLFTDENEGIAVKLYNFVDEFSASDGLISLREKSAKDARESVFADRETLELRMISFEQIVRGKYLNLDQTVSQLNRTGSALLAAL